MNEDFDLYAPVFDLRVRCSCGAQTIVVWDRSALDYVPLADGWTWTPGPYYTCGAPGHRQVDSVLLRVDHRNGLAALEHGLPISVGHSR